MAYRVVAAPADGQRPGEGEVEEGGRVAVDAGRRVQPLQVNVQRRLVVQGVHLVSGAAGDHHRVAVPAPAVPHRDGDRPVRTERRGDHAVLQHFGAVELLRGDHPHVVRGAATDQRYRRGDHAVRAADHLLLVAGERVGEHQGDPVTGAGQGKQGGGDPFAGAARVVAQAGGVSGTDVEGAAEADRDHAGAQGRSGADAAGRRAADDRYPRRLRRNPGEQCRKVVAERREDHQQPRIRAAQRAPRGRGAGGAGVPVGRVTHLYPSRTRLARHGGTIDTGPGQAEGNSAPVRPRAADGYRHEPSVAGPGMRTGGGARLVGRAAGRPARRAREPAGPRRRGGTGRRRGAATCRGGDPRPGAGPPCRTVAGGHARPARRDPARRADAVGGARVGGRAGLPAGTGTQPPAAVPYPPQPRGHVGLPGARGVRRGVPRRGCATRPARALRGEAGRRAGLGRFVRRRPGTVPAGRAARRRRREPGAADHGAQQPGLHRVRGGRVQRGLDRGRADVRVP